MLSQAVVVTAHELVHSGSARNELCTAYIVHRQQAAFDGTGSILVRDRLIHKYYDLILIFHIVDQSVDID